MMPCVFCDLLNIRTAKWNLHVLYNKGVKKLAGMSFVRLAYNGSLVATN